MKREVKRLRCAIYTRVSTEHGLEQDFNSSTRSARPPRPTSRAKPMRAGSWSRPITMMAASREGRWTALPCSGSWPTCSRIG